MSRQSQPSPQSKRAARLIKRHEAAYRALIALLIRQAEREVRDELNKAVEAPPDRAEKDGS